MDTEFYLLFFFSGIVSLQYFIVSCYILCIFSSSVKNLKKLFFKKKKKKKLTKDKNCVLEEA
jgi:hypothetical protein